MDKFKKIPSGIFDKVEDNKKEFISKFVNDLEELFPETVKDGVVDFQALLDRFGEYEEDNSVEKYNMTWMGKREAIREADEDIIGKTLKYVEEDSKNPETTQNLYIEGDNLEVLKLLRQSYYNKIKMIYIDPPYNTGSDFVYKDDFTMTEEEYAKLSGEVDEYGERLVKNSKDSGRFHSDWLNMMYPRLKVAKDLLKDDGVIFISIDDNEVHNMRKICDEIFGEKNFIAELIWEKKKKPSFLNVNLGTKTEYILTYGKDRLKVGALSVDTTEQGKKYPFNNAGNALNNLVFSPRSVRFANLNDGIILPQNMSEGNIKTELLNKLIIKDGYNDNEFTLRGEWRYSQNKLNEIIKNNEEIMISRIPFRPNHVKKGGEIKKMHNLLSISNYKVGTNEDATSEQEKLMGKSYFDYAKPTNLIKFLAQSATYNEKDAIVLDFFAGTSTTANSVIDLNREDEGNRKFIMVQLPETTDKKAEIVQAGYKNIAEIGKERIRRAGEQILEENKDKEGIENLDIGFKVFKVEDTNLKRVKDTVEEGIDLEKLKAISPRDAEDFNPHFTDIDVVYEMMLKRQDIELTEEVVQLDHIGERTYLVGQAILVCLEEKITEEMIDKIGSIRPALSWIILRDSAFDSNINLKLNAVKRLRAVIKETNDKKDQKIYWI